MMQLLTGLFLLFLALTGLLVLLFALYSYLEKEKLALRRSLFALLFYGLLLLAISFIPIAIVPWLMVSAAVIMGVLLSRFGNPAVNFVLPDKRFDERDVMFSRNTLREGDERYKSYYELSPDYKAADDSFRAEPGLLAKGASLYNELLFNAANATFQTVDLLQPLVEQEHLKDKTVLSDKKIAAFIKNWTIKLGAQDVGFTAIKPHHIYSHIGRGEAYGEEVKLEHKYAIAFTVEMSHESISYNPKGPVVMESAQQYLSAGQIAVQVAQFLRNLGIDARAHIDANYRLVCPIVAQDAGLGVIGRMGLLMTPKLGPRVRIAVVSTNLELPVNKRPLDYSAIHFCNICKKCARNCPSGAVSEASIDGNENRARWCISHDKCFQLWCKMGTDCGRCVAVCPYSHPDNFIHTIVRWMIKRNPINRRIALLLDDFFYGQIPKAAKLKNWMKG